MTVILIILSLILAVLLTMVIRLIVTIYRASVASERQKVNNSQVLPTISLCIPARNETHALADCLVSAISSDYPKLEIIVLDDCSQDKTSQIIRSFAHDGVRFVKGETPAEGWLGKNNAYATLANEARGEYLVFMSVDTRLETHSVSRLISYMIQEKLNMTSVLPRRRDVWRSSVLFAPLRYFWQVVLPQRWNTPTATSLWTIKESALSELGGIEAFKNNIMIENSLAAKLASRGSYQFLLADNTLSVWYAKKWSSQIDTSIRLWFALLQKNVAISALVVIMHLVVFSMPLVALLLFVSSAVDAHPLLFGLTVVNSILVAALYFQYCAKTRQKTMSGGLSAIVSALLLPLMAAQEAGLIVMSIVKYKRGTVSWKGRNVCYPVLPRRRFDS